MHVGGSDTASYEAQLAAEGLAPLDTRDSRTPDGFRDSRHINARDIEESAAAVEAWRAWAAAVDRAYPFRKRSQRAVWRLYAQGVSVRDIPAKRGGGDFREVARTIARIKAKSPPGPPNPWHRGGNRPNERTSMAIRTLHYTQIALHRPTKTPVEYGKMTEEVFNNVDGTPHYGGVDIEVKGGIVLATWSNIKSALRKPVTE